MGGGMGGLGGLGGLGGPGGFGGDMEGMLNNPMVLEQMQQALNDPAIQQMMSDPNMMQQVEIFSLIVHLPDKMVPDHEFQSNASTDARR